MIVNLKGGPGAGLSTLSARRGGRVVYCARLESERCPATGSVGSNPTPSSISQYYPYMNISDLIVSDPEILSGTPVFRGTRVPVEQITHWLRIGMTTTEIRVHYPSVSAEQIEQLKQRLGL